MLEIKDHANTQGCDAKVVQHQSTFMVGDLVNYVRIYDKRIKSDQVRNEEANLVAFVKDIERRLLLKAICRSKNSTTNAFSYGFSTSP